MSGPAQAPATFYRPAEVAALLHCSEWWIKEQARRRRIPYCWIGGGYRFTPEHVAEIGRLFEVRPVESAKQVSAPRGSAAPREDGSTAVVRLHARAPRRVRTAADAA